MDSAALPAWFIDGVLGFTVLEFVALAWYRQRSGKGLPLTDLVYGLLPGFLLMLSLRLSGPAFVSLPVAACLAGAGLAHGVDFYRRFLRSANGVG